MRISPQVKLVSTHNIHNEASGKAYRPWWTNMEMGIGKQRVQHAFEHAQCFLPTLVSAGLPGPNPDCSRESMGKTMLVKSWFPPLPNQKPSLPWKGVLILPWHRFHHGRSVGRNSSGKFWPSPALLVLMKSYKSRIKPRNVLSSKPFSSTK